MTKPNYPILPDRIKFIAILFLFLTVGCSVFKHTPQQVASKLGPNPYFEFDGHPVLVSELKDKNPDEIAIVSQYTGKDAVQKFGEKAKDGAVTIFTKRYATEKYETLLSSFSPTYKKMLNSHDREEIQYILNGDVLKENYEGYLSAFTPKMLKDVSIIDQHELEQNYQVENKSVGVVIQSHKLPKTKHLKKKK